MRKTRKTEYGFENLIDLDFGETYVKPYELSDMIMKSIRSAAYNYQQRRGFKISISFGENEIIMTKIKR